ncbi:MAG: PAC2 family protein [Ilumatobacteraceae bacterium]|nr:PAC2 family protein [Ilumatobacteraceae bacterium]
MAALRHVGDRPVLDKPVLITMLSGWIDASGAANAAIDALKKATNATLLANFDPDTFIDYRARRPIM